jgi:hypothetical protein
MLALLTWGIMINLAWIDVFRTGGLGAQFVIAEISFLVAAALLLVGVMMEWRERLAPLAVIVQRVSMIGALLALYVLTLRVGYSRFDGMVWQDPGVGVWLSVAVLVALAVVAALGLLVLRQGRSVLTPGVARSGQLLLAAIAILVLLRLFMGPLGVPPTALYIAFNLLYYAVLLWLIYVGYVRGDAFRVNLGFILFALGMIVLYFDLFWTLMNRSFFFMGGGLLLCAGGYALEAQRRRLVRRLGGTDGEGEPA